MKISYKQLAMFAGVCRSSRERLLEYLARDDLFAESFRRYFEGSTPPFVIYDSEPTQVVVLKKIINLFERIENANSILQKTTSLESLQDLFHAIYELIQVINHSSLLWQDIFGLQLSYINTILLKLNQTISEWEQPEFTTTIANVVNLVPEQVQKGASVLQINQLIFMLPSYFESLQSMISREESSITRNDPAYLEQIRKNTQKMQDYLNQLLTSDSARLPIDLSVFAMFVKHTYELLDSGAPLTQTLHQEAVDGLNHLRHELIPTLISELERLEDKMNLKPMTLVGPTLVQMEKYYHLLAEHISHLPWAMEQLESIPRPPILVDSPKALPKTVSSDARSLQTMQDSLFMQKIQEQRTARFHQACAEREVLRPKVEASSNFFNTLYSIHNNLTDFSTEKQRLLIDYERFKLHVQAVAPHIDKLITQLLNQENLNKPTDGIWRKFFTYVLGSETLQTILNHEEFINSSLEQELAQKRFDVALIKESSTQRINPVPLTEPDVLSYKTHHEPEKKLLFMQIRDLGLSEQIKSLRNELQHFFEDYLEPEVFKQLSFNDSNSPLPEIPNETESIVIYQSIVNTLGFLQTGLSTLEEIHDLGNPTDFIPRARYLYKMAFVSDCLLKVQSCLNKASRYPGVQVMLDHGLGRLLESISTISGVPDSLNFLLNEKADMPAQVVDLDGLGDQVSEEKGISLKEHIRLFNKNLSLLSTSPLKATYEAIRLLQLVSDDLDALQKKGAHLVRPFIAMLSQTLLSTMDDLEFNLGLKPGVLSEKLKQQIDLFYQTLSFPTEKERLQCRISVIDKRIAHEESRESVPDLVKKRWVRRIDCLKLQKRALVEDLKTTLLRELVPKRLEGATFYEVFDKEISGKFSIDDLMSFSVDEIILKIMDEVKHLKQLAERYSAANQYLQECIGEYEKIIANGHSNPIVVKTLSWLVKEQKELMDTTHFDLSFIKKKRGELKERVASYKALDKANYFIKQIETCLIDQPQGALRDEKLELLAKLKKKCSLDEAPTLTPRERLIALRNEMSVDNEAILRRDGSPILVKWIKSLWSFMTGWQPLEVKKMSELKGMLDTIKADASSGDSPRLPRP